MYLYMYTTSQPPQRPCHPDTLQLLSPRGIKRCCAAELGTPNKGTSCHESLAIPYQSMGPSATHGQRGGPNIGIRWLFAVSTKSITSVTLVVVAKCRKQPKSSTPFLH